MATERIAMKTERRRWERKAFRRVSSSVSSACPQVCAVSCFPRFFLWIWKQKRGGGGMLDVWLWLGMWPTYFSHSHSDRAHRTSRSRRAVAREGGPRRRSPLPPYPYMYHEVLNQQVSHLLFGALSRVFSSLLISSCLLYFLFHLP